MTHNATIIDVWNVDTFDADLRSYLDANADDMLSSRRQELE